MGALEGIVLRLVWDLSSFVITERKNNCQELRPRDLV